MPVKSVEQQAILAVHRARSGLVAERTAQLNRLRALLAPNTEPVSLALSWTVTAEGRAGGVVFEGRAANPYVQIPIVTSIGYARNVAVVKTAQAGIAVGGSYGTLSEIAFALLSGIPVIGLNTRSLSRNGKEDTSIIIAENAADAVDLAVSLSSQ